MKGNVRKKSYSVFIWSNFITLPALGWYIGGIVPALIGLALAITIDALFPTWKYELTWKDIGLALKNLRKYGDNPCELCFRIGKKKIFVYRDENGSDEEPLRMAVRIPYDDWEGFFGEEGIEEIVDDFGGMGMDCEGRKPSSYIIFPATGLEGCKDILSMMFEKAVGGLRPDIYARGIVSARKNIWVDHKYNG
jgi:hypothetical protein